MRAQSYIFFSFSFFIQFCHMLDKAAIGSRNACHSVRSFIRTFVRAKRVLDELERRIARPVTCTLYTALWKCVYTFDSSVGRAWDCNGNTMRSQGHWFDPGSKDTFADFALSHSDDTPSGC